MVKLSLLTQRLLTLWHNAKSHRLQWRLTHHAQQHSLKQTQRFAEQQLTAELKKRQTYLNHELTLLKTAQQLELKRLKMQGAQDIKDYQDYLIALDTLKQTIRSTYSHLPDVLALTIHHHAKQLLHAMWEADDGVKKHYYEAQLLHFIATLQEETQLQHALETKTYLPEKTLRLIQQQK